MSRTVVLLLLLTASGPGPADADVVRLKNGNTLEGTITAADERQVTIEIPDVGKLVVERAEIAELQQTAGSSESEDGTPQAGQPAAHKREPILTHAGSHG